MSTSPLVVTFVRAHGPEKRKGPYRQIRLEGETMRADDSRQLIARHEGQHWDVDGTAYTRAECSCSAMLHFVGADGTRSKSYGPFESVSFVDGIAYADHKVFAFADRSIGDWYCHEDGHHYPVVVIDPR